MQHGHSSPPYYTTNSLGEVSLSNEFTESHEIARNEKDSHANFEVGNGYQGEQLPDEWLLHEVTGQFIPFTHESAELFTDKKKLVCLNDKLSTNLEFSEYLEAFVSICQKFDDMCQNIDNGFPNAMLLWETAHDGLFNLKSLFQAVSLSLQQCSANPPPTTQIEVQRLSSNSKSKPSNFFPKKSDFEYLLDLPARFVPDPTKLTEDLSCEVAGVHWDKRSWIASWYDKGKRHYRSFSAKTYGFYKAKFWAIAVRLSKVEKYCGNRRSRHIKQPPRGKKILQ